MLRRQGTQPVRTKVEVDWPDSPKLSKAEDQAALANYHERMKESMQRKLESLAQAIPVADTTKKG